MKPVQIFYSFSLPMKQVKGDESKTDSTKPGEILRKKIKEKKLASHLTKSERELVGACIAKIKTFHSKIPSTDVDRHICPVLAIDETDLESTPDGHLGKARSDSRAMQAIQLIRAQGLVPITMEPKDPETGTSPGWVVATHFGPRTNEEYVVHYDVCVLIFRV